MSTAIVLMLWRFAAASAGSVLLALLLATVLPRAARRWPALAAHRSTWLLAQGAVALVLMLACVPLPRTGAVPAITIDAATDATIAAAIDATIAAPVDTMIAATRPAPIDTAISAASSTASSAAPTPTARPAAPAQPAPPRRSPDARPLLAWLPAAWLLVYLAGLTWHSARRLLASRRWHRRLLRDARAVSLEELVDWPAITQDQRERIAAARLTVLATTLPMSPLLLGGRRRRFVLPTHLHTLTPTQQRLIVEHELTHLRRRDPDWLTLAATGALLFWFNRPFLHLVDGLREAVELGCDDAVLAGRAPRERQGYAAALVAQLKLERGAMKGCGAPAFGQLGVTGRVLRMRETRPARLALRGRLVCAAIAVGLAGAGVALQPAFSATAGDTAPGRTISITPAAPAPSSATAADSAGAGLEPWRYPIAAPLVTSLYGMRSDIVKTGHHGVDFRARRGTPVLAVARGTVVESATNPTWGNYVRIDHGTGRSSLVMHLDHADVVYGQHVTAGDVIGASGATGRATGPHLHFEYWLNGARLNPALMLTDVSAHATARARARRREQGNPVPSTD